MARLDSRSVFPSGFQEYLELYSWSFSKKAWEYAVSKMRKKDPSTGKEVPCEKKTKEQMDEFFKKYGVDISKAKGYDAYYLYSMCVCDFYKSSISDEAHVALYVKDVIEDTDGYEGMVFSRWYADCISRGEQPPWLDLI